MVEHHLRAKLVVRVSVAPAVTEAQIRSFFASYRDEAETYVQGIVDGAPPVAQAILKSTDWNLYTAHLNGLWEIYPKLNMAILTAATIRRSQVVGYLAGYAADMKTKVSNIVGSAPPAAAASIDSWYRLSLDGDVVP